MSSLIIQLPFNLPNKYLNYANQLRYGTGAEASPWDLFGGLQRLGSAHTFLQKVSAQAC